ncbi:MAG: UDP-2,3-diacylglucosamine diphosphatase [Comamonadaceae bacterium]|nr:UDP-2,3-diacylglucosamine diphosphatase [Comamonadaceae bacterium]
MSAPPLPTLSELAAPAGWQTVDFLADLHLHASEPATFAAWQRYLQATPADALFILGDLFEVWIGDDAATAGSFEARCADVLRAAAARRPVYFMRGNRDFLVGHAFLSHCQVQDLADPTVLVFGGARWLLSHGDALCLDDTAYQQFRQQVRQPAWQQAFLARPLDERAAIARQMRQHSQMRQQGQAPETYADVNEHAARAWLRQARCATLIHGHTHRPADHALGDGLARIVLSDWHLDGPAPRAQVLRLTARGHARLSLAEAA